jgi:D-alanyl-D-alanine carboxypeptidase
MIARARRIAFHLTLSLAIAMGALPALISASPAVAAPMDEARYAAIVIDARSGEVLYAKRADSPRYPASITKVMTLYLAFDALATGRLKPTDTIVISPRAAAQAPSKLGLAAGQTITVDDAIRALAIKSANDIAVAMAEKIGGTETRFAAYMTLKARELGMTNSRFVNASGLPDSRQISSARDIAILSRAVMRDYPQYYAYFSQKSWNFRGQTMNNHNGLLFRMPGVDGIKTGFTNASGYNLAASATRDNKRLIAVVMGGSSNRARDNHVEQLLDTGFDVMRRRDRGELITVAQSYFEPREAAMRPGQYVMASAQGDLEASEDGASAPMRPMPTPAAGATMRPIPDPLDQPRVALATARASDLRPAAVLKAEDKPAKAAAKAVKAAEVEKKSKGKKKGPNGDYLVQVGAFKSKAEAKDWLKETSRRFGQHFDDADPKVISSDGWYRARYEGLTKDGAAAACKSLKAKRLACMVMKP